MTALHPAVQSPTTEQTNKQTNEISLEVEVSMCHVAVWESLVLFGIDVEKLEFYPLKKHFDQFLVAINLDKLCYSHLSFSAIDLRDALDF